MKGNQPKLLKQCLAVSKTQRVTSQDTQTGKRERNRIEKRTTTVFHKDSYDLGDTWNQFLQTVIRVKRSVQTFNTKTKQFESSIETAFYVSTTDKLCAKEFGNIIRSHWGIENSNHYVRDVSLREDFSRVRKNPENVATLRSFALNLLRTNGVTNVSQALYRNAVNVRRVLDYVGVKG